MAGKKPIGRWLDEPPKKPRVGAGREALARKARAKAKGGRERKRSAEAARRGLSRSRNSGRAGRKAGAKLRNWGPAAELMRFSRVVEQTFLNRQRLTHVLLAIASVWVLWTFVFGDAGVPRLLWAKHENSKLRAENEDLSFKEAALIDTVEALGNPKDREALEKVAREEHALVRDGELLVRFYGGEHRGAPGPAAEDASPGPPEGESVAAGVAVAAGGN